MLPCRSTVTTTFSSGMPSFLAEPSMMRRLAWCGTSQSRSSAVGPGGLEGGLDHVGDHADGMLEDLAALHPQMADRARGATGRHRHRACRDARRRSAAGPSARRGRQPCPRLPGLPARSRRRRRRRARRSCGRSSRGCARRSRRRSPAPACEPTADIGVRRRHRVDEARADRLQVEGRRHGACRAGSGC